MHRLYSMDSVSISAPKGQYCSRGAVSSVLPIRNFHPPAAFVKQVIITALETVFRVLRLKNGMGLPVYKSTSVRLRWEQSGMGRTVFVPTRVTIGMERNA